MIQKFRNGNTTCYVESLKNHGSVRVFPCLQIYVTPLSNEGDTTKSNLCSSDIVRTRNDVSTSHTVESSSRKIPDLSNKKSESDCNNEKNVTKNVLLLYQNEYNFAGQDHLYRRCSFLPSFCPNDLKLILSDTCSYSFAIGSVNSTIDCFYDEEKNRVIRERRISTSNIVNSILWPLLGMIVSTACCVGFWKHNYKHISRLYIYNSWSAT